MRKIGFIDYFLHEWHADNIPAWISEISDGAMKVCYAWGEIDNPNGKTNVQWSEELGIELCGSIEEVIQKSDFLIVLSPDNPERHVDLCRLPLMSGKPTYVDKTFALSLTDTKQIMENVKQTPYYTCSALRYAKEIKGCMGKDIVMVDSRGSGTTNYIIHQLEPLYMMMGKACQVTALGEPDEAILLFEYSDKRRAAVNYGRWEHDFHTIVRYADGSRDDLTLVSEYFIEFTKDLLKFFETGIPPVSEEEIWDIMSMLDASIKAASTPGTWVTI